MTAAQQTSGKALMVMRDGELTAAMTFLKSQRQVADPGATR